MTVGKLTFDEYEFKDGREEMEYRWYLHILETLEKLPYPCGVHFTQEEYAEIREKAERWLLLLRACEMTHPHERFKEKDG